MIRQILLKNDILLRSVAARTYSQAPTGSKSSAGQTAAPKPVSGDVPGLSSKCVHNKTGPIGPGASRDGVYKVPEYYCYDKNSYFEAEIEMQKFRLPQPSSKQ